MKMTPWFSAHLVLVSLVIFVSGALAATITAETIITARAAYDRGDWKTAIPLLASIAAQTNENGNYRFMLARARFKTNDYAGAIPEYLRALELKGADPAVIAFRIAECNAHLGRRDEALRWLRISIEGGYRYLEDARTDDAFAIYAAQPEFRLLLGVVDRDTVSRNEGWREDIRFLVEWVKRKSYHPFRTRTADRYASRALYTEPEFDAQAEQLGAHVATLTDTQIEIALMRLVAAIGDGHTAVWGSKSRDFTLSLPLGFYLFDDGLYVISAAQQYKSLMGMKVIAFDGHSANEALAAVDPLIGRDNTMWVKAQQPHFVRHTVWLKELGIANEDSGVTLTVESERGARRSVRVDADQTMPDTWNMLPKPKGWVWIGDSSTADFQLRNDDPHWWTWHAAKRLLYVQYNNIWDGEKETLADFAASLARAIAEYPVDKLVIDLRNNNGGDTYKGEAVLHAIMMSKANAPGHLYIIIGRRTFSAAGNAASYLAKHTQALFVGEPTGSKPNSPGDETAFTLPYSGIEVNLSDRYWQGSWPDDFSDWRAPDIAVPVRAGNYIGGVDAAMKAIEEQPSLPAAD